MSSSNSTKWETDRWTDRKTDVRCRQKWKRKLFYLREADCGEEGLLVLAWETVEKWQWKNKICIILSVGLIRNLKQDFAFEAVEQEKYKTCKTSMFKKHRLCHTTLDCDHQVLQLRRAQTSSVIISFCTERAEQSADCWHQPDTWWQLFNQCELPDR